MSGPELTLEHPFEFDGVIYDKLTLSDFDSLMGFRSNSPEQVIRSMALCFDTPRRVVRHLHPDDANRAGDLIARLLDETTRSLNSFE